MIEANIKGDKFIWSIVPTETGERTKTHLLMNGWDGTIYQATRKAKRGNREFIALVYRCAKTNEFKFAV